MNFIKTVKKLWGKEEWLVNNDKYCAKYLWIDRGYACSLHYHPIKHETFIVTQGGVELEIYPKGDHQSKPEFIKLGVGDTYTIEPGVPHRFRSCGYLAKGIPTVTIPTSNACVLEVSTPHSDEDVIRIVESMKEDTE